MKKKPWVLLVELLFVTVIKTGRGHLLVPGYYGGAKLIWKLAYCGDFHWSNGLNAMIVKGVF